MSARPGIRPLLGALMADRQAQRFGLGVCLGLGFSIAVILATIGIMDGFVSVLKGALHRASGDLIFHARNEFFPSDEAEKAAKAAGVKDLVLAVQVEGFLIANDISRGVQVRGLVPERFEALTGVGLAIQKDELALGDELAQQLGVKVGDQVALALAHTGDSPSGLPGVHRARVGQVVRHGVYQKDLRMAYAHVDNLQTWAGVPAGRSNWGSANAVGADLENARAQLQGELGGDFVTRPYWQEFSSLIQAVETEKLVIGLMLQLIVVIACFNVIAFAVFLNEKKARELFLFKALGLSPKGLRRLWASITFGLWALSCLFSLVMLMAFNWCLGNLPILKLPGKIYNVERLELILSPSDFAMVFAGAGVWAFMVSLPGLRRLSKGPVLAGLRKEFS